jgi:hypothetical protein
MPLVRDDEAELLARFGITRVPVFHYHYRGWRYSNVDDAVAQAKRDVASRRA